MNDRQLSPSIRLRDFPCWERADAADVVWLEWIAKNIWQPVIDRWGPVTFTSWKYWRDPNCTRARTGDHAHAGTVDAVPTAASITDVHRWMGANLPGRDWKPLWGSLIHERDHIHQTVRGVGTPDGRPEFLTEPTEGVYRLARIPPSTAAFAAVAALLYLLWRGTRP